MNFEEDWIREKIHLIDSFQQIPKLLHLIWVGDKPVPDYAKEYGNKWSELMPEWKVILWTNESLTEKEFDREILNKINQAHKGAQKADIMRYFIIERYGGFYVDTDTVPLRSLDPLTKLGFDLIIYHDNSITWDYCCNSPFGAVPHHPVVQKACQLCRSANINTNDIHLHTGPHLWGQAIKQTPMNGKKIGLLNYPYFGGKDFIFEDKFATNLYAASWMIR